MSTPVRIGNWSVSEIPRGWELVSDGLRRSLENVFPSNVVFTEEPLAVGMTVHAYIENQIQVMRQLLRDPQIKGPEATPGFNSEQSQTLWIAHQSSEGHPMVQTQTYAVVEEQVGIVTFTTVEQERADVENDFKTIAKGLRFQGQTK